MKRDDEKQTMSACLPPHQQEPWREPLPPPRPPRDPAGNPLWALVGAAMIAGAIYQVASGSLCFFFPPQVDGVAGLFGLALGAKAALYVSSFLGAVCGVLLFWLSSPPGCRQTPPSPPA